MSNGKNDYSHLGKNIRSLRKFYGEKQLDLALAIDVSGPNVISQYESGDRVPERDYLIRIAHHYRITENELLYDDYSHLPNLSKLRIFNKTFLAASLNAQFPLICTPHALEDVDFQKAYELHRNFMDSLMNDADTEDNAIDCCISLYEKASRRGVIEATANHLGFLIFVGSTLTTLTPRFLDILDIRESNSVSFEDFREGYLPSFDDMDGENDFDTSLEKLDFLEAFEKDIFHDIVLLRRSKDYADLGDYYLAQRHRLGLLTNTLSLEMNSAVGNEMLVTFERMGNKYCKQLKELSKKL